MIFLPQDTTLFILTERGDNLVTEQQNTLICENGDWMVEMVVPTIRTAHSVNLTIITTHVVSGEVFEFRAETATIKPYLVSATFKLNAELPNGQYHYTLSDEDGMLQQGLLQVGLVPGETVEYQPTMKTISYEG